MSQTYTRSETETFNLSHAKYLSSKVTADMDRCRQMYGHPTLSEIESYGTELALMLRDGYVESYEFGFIKEGKRVISWRYTVSESGLVGGDQRPGGVYARADITGASPFNHMYYSSKWFGLTDGQRDTFREGLPFKRTTGTGPQDGAGYWFEERTYSAASVAMTRKNFRPNA